MKVMLKMAKDRLSFLESMVQVEHLGDGATKISSDMHRRYKASATWAVAPQSLQTRLRKTKVGVARTPVKLLSRLSRPAANGAYSTTTAVSRRLEKLNEIAKQTRSPEPRSTAGKRGSRGTSCFGGMRERRVSTVKGVEIADGEPELLFSDIAGQEVAKQVLK
ncbi:hypothetical protein HPB51_024791 [Rhipicephalus microplus]|uniref:Uncharacterized protein n=1 Tax=Rhipicephalus microplus TaxID=6941 RepID=A0A9J6DDA6_RHIMP|nr:hypothetical protein HPB51_024791 [Rhipicephalus microplus]